MLSRTAESLFWLARYMERAENTARLLEAAARLSALPSSSTGPGQPASEWESAILACGLEGPFYAIHEEATARNVVDFLAFSLDNPSSIRSCLEIGRANARSVRTALTLEMWEAINSAWLELKRFRTVGHSRPELMEFINFVKRSALLLDGLAYRTMLRTDSFAFCRIGTYLERADATGRILDVKYHVLLPKDAPVGGGLDYFQWSSILRSVSALTAYHWVYKESLKPWLVADLLILREEMPRSLASCYANLVRYLDDLARYYGRQGQAQRKARDTHALLRNRSIDAVFSEGLHEFVEGFIGENNLLGNAITEQYLV